MVNMNISFTDRFKKRFNKLSPKVRKQFEERIEFFIENPSNPILRMHPLKGNLAGLRAFSVTGDYRVIYRILDRENVKLIDIGTHAQVY